MDNLMESDEALRRVYGEAALFSRVGAFTLVHLDSPTPEQIAQRVSEFDPDEFFFDQCPLCESAKASGGHIIFDGPDEPDQLREGAASEAFDAALGDLAATAEAFSREATPVLSDALARRYDEDVARLHDRLVETLWAEESTARVEVFERQLARALTTIAEVCTDVPALTTRARPLEDALEGVAAVWRNL